MAKQKKKQKRKRRADVILLFLIIFSLFFFSFGDKIVTVVRLDRDLRDAENRLIEANVRRLELEEERAQLNNDDYLMTLARRDLGYILPGEKVMVESKVSADLLEKQETEVLIAD